MVSLQVLHDMVHAILNSDNRLLDELLSTEEIKAVDYLKHCVPADGALNGISYLEGQTLLHIAADHSRHKCVRVILQHLEPEARAELCNKKEENQKSRIPLHTVLDGGKTFLHTFLCRTALLN